MEDVARITVTQEQRDVVENALEQVAPCMVGEPSDEGPCLKCRQWQDLREIVDLWDEVATAKEAA